MPTQNKIATVFTTPAPSFGALPLTAGDVTGHAFVESQTGLSGNGDNQVNRSGDWSGFQKPPGIIKSINLRFDWGYDLNLSYTVSVGAPGAGGAFGLTEADYSINNGGSWIFAGGFILQSQTSDGFAHFEDTGSVNIVIPPTTPFNQIRVRDTIQAQVQISGDDGGSSGNSQVNFRLQNIRLEVVFLPPNSPLFVF